MQLVSVIVPAYNEETSIVEILERVSAQKVSGFELEVIVVDDCSTDRTAELLVSRPDLYKRLIRRAQNGGKGAAVKDALAVATGEYVLFQDADLEYDPAEYAKLLKPISLHNADLVLGSRMIAPEMVRVFYLTHLLGNRLITWTFNILNNTTFSDVYSCYLVLRRRLIDPDGLRTIGWEQHGEILSRGVRGERSSTRSRSAITAAPTRKARKSGRTTPLRSCSRCSMRGFSPPGHRPGPETYF